MNHSDVDVLARKIVAAIEIPDPNNQLASVFADHLRSAYRNGRDHMREDALTLLADMKNRGLQRAGGGCFPVVPPTKCRFTEATREAMEDAWRLAALQVKALK